MVRIGKSFLKMPILVVLANLKNRIVYKMYIVILIIKKTVVSQRVSNKAD